MYFGSATDHNAWFLFCLVVFLLFVVVVILWEYKTPLPILYLYLSPFV